jgi:hypothetical protein
MKRWKDGSAARSTDANQEGTQGEEESAPGWESFRGLRGRAGQAHAIFINKNAFKSNKKLVLFLSWPKLSQNGG